MVLPKQYFESVNWFTQSHCTDDFGNVWNFQIGITESENYFVYVTKYAGWDTLCFILKKEETKDYYLDALAEIKRRIN